MSLFKEKERSIMKNWCSRIGKMLLAASMCMGVVSVPILANQSRSVVSEPEDVYVDIIASGEAWTCLTITASIRHSRLPEKQKAAFCRAGSDGTARHSSFRRSMKANS